MAKNLIGTSQLDSYDPNKEVWENYHERMELWFEANDIKAAQYVPTLLTMNGSETYGILKDLLAPDPKKVSHISS